MLKHIALILFVSKSFAASEESINLFPNECEALSSAVEASCSNQKVKGIREELLSFSTQNMQKIKGMYASSQNDCSTMSYNILNKCKSDCGEAPCIWLLEEKTKKSDSRPTANTDNAPLQTGTADGPPGNYLIGAPTQKKKKPYTIIQATKTVKEEVTPPKEVVVFKRN